MISIRKAEQADCEMISSIGKVSVVESHMGSNPIEILNEYAEKYYNPGEIKKELSEPANHYYIISYNEKKAGFSKIVFNAGHPGIVQKNVAKLDRIYLSKEYQGLKLGLQLLQFNMELAKKNQQSGLWLYTWIGNKKAVDFYTRAGFKIIGRHDFHVTESYYDPSHQMLLIF